MGLGVLLLWGSSTPSALAGGSRGVNQAVKSSSGKPPPAEPMDVSEALAVLPPGSWTDPPGACPVPGETLDVGASVTALLPSSLPALSQAIQGILDCDYLKRQDVLKAYPFLNGLRASLEGLKDRVEQSLGASSSSQAKPKKGVKDPLAQFQGDFERVLNNATADPFLQFLRANVKDELPKESRLEEQVELPVIWKTRPFEGKSVPLYFQERNLIDQTLDQGDHSLAGFQGWPVFQQCGRVFKFSQRSRLLKIARQQLSAYDADQLFWKTTTQTVSEELKEQVGKPLIGILKALKTTPLDQVPLESLQKRLSDLKEAFVHRSCLTAQKQAIETLLEKMAACPVLQSVQLTRLKEQGQEIRHALEQVQGAYTDYEKKRLIPLNELGRHQSPEEWFQSKWAIQRTAFDAASSLLRQHCPASSPPSGEGG